MTRHARWILCVGLALAVVGCGHGRAGVSPDAGAQLKPRVAEIRALATARQADQASAALADLRRLVADLHSRHELTDQGAGNVLAAADAVSAQLVLITTTTTIPPTTTTTVATASSDGGGGDNGAGKGHGKGKGGGD